MKATEASLLGFLRKAHQFVIPIYQRTYSWTEKECRQLWDDILKAGKDDETEVHFIGSIVYIEEGLSTVVHQAPLLVIDGQQRLTTVSLLLAALADALGDDEPLEGFSARRIRNYYLVNPEEGNERHYKLLLSQTDKQSLMHIVGDVAEPPEPSVRVTENYERFKSWIAAEGGDLATVCKGIGKLVVVDIALSRGQDDPQLIFESMNSTGRELSQADLIRNFMLMDLEPSLQSRLYEHYWRPMETAFGQEAYSTHFDSFMRHYLTAKTGEIPRIHEVYEAFKSFAKSRDSQDPSAESIVKDLRDYADYYCAMALGAEDDRDLSHAFRDLRELKVDPAYPLLLELYADYNGGRLNGKDLCKMVRIIESYVFRRAICAIPTNSFNKTFTTFYRMLDRERYLESFIAQFLVLRSYRRFPDDDEFIREFQVRDVYNFRAWRYWLRKFENHGRKERVVPDDYTIEHIMPQNENMNDDWKEELGDEWRRVHETYLHRAGNLTLTGYNSEYSDRPFAEKRDMEGGFRQSPLRVNSDLRDADNWSEDSIIDRSKRLATDALDVWEMPTLSDDVLQGYREEETPDGSYTIDDHQYLRGGITRELFEEFRREVKALNPCVSEEFMKVYVAFKAETNFVDVVPLAKELSLTLNLPYSEINDERNLCRDITGLGRWGNGDVEVRLDSLADLRYVVDLVRQALTRQLGDD